MSATNYDIVYRKRQIEPNFIPKSKYEYTCRDCKELFLTIYSHQKDCDPCREKPKEPKKVLGRKKVTAEVRAENQEERKAKAEKDRKFQLMKSNLLSRRM
tara:strand:- start:937 stop:1236 length:300 start_codon:yes stop_codon:yes gene_type:complete